MHSHVVLYKTNPNNPNAASQIVEYANDLLWRVSIQLPGTQIHATTIPPPTRVVGESKFQVILNFIFPDEVAYRLYMGHELHMRFVKFVLKGWMLEGDSGEGAGERFIEHILKAPSGDPPKKSVRNPLIPESNVVWAGEMVIDA